MSKEPISKDRVIQIVLAVLVIVLVFALIGKNKGENGAWDIDGDEKADEAMMDEEAAEEGGSAAAPAGQDNAPAENSAYAGGTCTPGLSGEKSVELNAILLNWTPCANLDEFQFYKLVKSSIVADPSYPNDPVAFSSANKNAANFVDKTVARATTYNYRLCVVQRLNKVTCSNKVSVTY